jgi:hypothetical protein
VILCRIELLNAILVHPKTEYCYHVIWAMLHNTLQKTISTFNFCKLPFFWIMMGLGGPDGFYP